MRINLPGFSHANYIVFLIIQQEFPSPLTFNYMLTRYFSPVPLWAATCGESLWCVIITGGRGTKVLQNHSAAVTGQVLVFIWHRFIISAGWTPLLLWLLLKGHSVPTLLAHFDTSLHPIWIPLYHSLLQECWGIGGIEHTKSYRPVDVQNIQSKLTKQAMHTHSWCPDFWGASLFI